MATQKNVEGRNDWLGDAKELFRMEYPKGDLGKRSRAKIPHPQFVGKSLGEIILKYQELATKEGETDGFLQSLNGQIAELIEFLRENSHNHVRISTLRDCMRAKVARLKELQRYEERLEARGIHKKVWLWLGITNQSTKNLDIPRRPRGKKSVKKMPKTRKGRRRWAKKYHRNIPRAS